MIVDAQLKFSDNQSIAGGAPNPFPWSTNTIDQLPLGAIQNSPRALGIQINQIEKPMWLVALGGVSFWPTGPAPYGPGTPFAGAGGTLTIQLQTSDDPGVDTNPGAGLGPTNLSILWQSPAITLAQLNSGKPLFRIAMPLGLRRYLRLYYVNAGLTAGTISAGLTTSVGSHAAV